MTFPVQVGPSTITISRDDRVLVCQPDGRIISDAEDGFFTRDSRFISDYDIWINGRRPLLLSSAQLQFFSSRFEFTNDTLIDDEGPIERQSLSLRLDRTVAEGVHEDYDIANYARRPVRITLEIAIRSDFADIFDVKSGQVVRRGALNTRWLRSRGELRTSYRNGEFRRELIVAAERASTPPQYANGRLVFVATIPPKGVWHTCLKWLPVTAMRRRLVTLDCNAVEAPLRQVIRDRLPNVSIETRDPGISRAWDQAVRDMEALRLEDPTFERGVFIPAAGIPWFVTLFGRDSLIVSMQGISGFPEFAAGALRRLSELQATDDDPERDMEPGKILHEIRHGELAQLGILPFQPYYGTHDATSLFVIVLSYLYHWLGDPALLHRYLGNAEAAMAWIDRFGDRDRDGFQEYATRSSHGYYNQGWKDAGDAIPDEKGTLAPLPIATCELQGYVYDAKLRLAEVYEVLGRPKDARRLTREAARLYERFNEAFWWEAEGTYYLGLDGAKRPIRSVASNAGPPPAVGDRPAGASRPRRATPARRRHVVGLGRAHAVLRSSRLQPVLLPHGIGLAARQRDHRRGVPPLRLRGRGRAGRQGHVRRRRAAARTPAARAVLGPAAGRGKLPRAVSRGERPPGVGGRIGLPVRLDAVRDPRDGRTRRIDGLRQSGPARLDAGAVDPQPAGRPWLDVDPDGRRLGRGAREHDGLRGRPRPGTGSVGEPGGRSRRRRRRRRQGRLDPDPARRATHRKAPGHPEGPMLVDRLRFGISITPTADAYPDLVRQVLAAEHGGLDLVGIQDHPYQRRFLDTFALIADLLARTSRLSFFPDVANLPLRGPTMIAKAAASLDVMSGGRFELGLGAGGFWDAVAGMGGPRRSTAEAAAALEEAVPIIRAVLDGERVVRGPGPLYPVPGYPPGPPPAHRVEIWIGAYRPRGMRLIGRLADGWVPSFGYLPPDAFRTAAEAARRCGGRRRTRPARHPAHLQPRGHDHRWRAWRRATRRAGPALGRHPDVVRPRPRHRRLRVLAPGHGDA